MRIAKKITNISTKPSLLMVVAEFASAATQNQRNFLVPTPIAMIKVVLDNKPQDLFFCE